MCIPKLQRVVSYAFVALMRLSRRRKVQVRHPSGVGQNCHVHSSLCAAGQKCASVDKRMVFEVFTRLCCAISSLHLDRTERDSDYVARHFCQEIALSKTHNLAQAIGEGNTRYVFSTTSVQQQNSPRAHIITWLTAIT